MPVLLTSEYHDVGKDGSVSSELFSERFNRIGREVQQLVEHWDNRLVLPPTKLPERYLGGHLSFHLHWTFTVNSEVSGVQLPRHLFPESQQLCFCPEVHVHAVDRQDQFPVLVANVHIVDDPKRISTRVGSCVRLQPLDSCQSRRAGDSLYLSTVSGHFVFCDRAGLRPFQEHGKLDLSGGGLCLEVGGGQLPHQMIEARSQVMDDFTGKHAESRLDNPGLDEINQFLKRFTILLGEDWFHIFICGEGNDGNGSQKLVNFGVQLTDILFGPF